MELADVQLARADAAIAQNDLAHRFPFFFGLYGYSVLDWMELPPQLPAWNMASVCQARPSALVYAHMRVVLGTWGAWGHEAGYFDVLVYTFIHLYVMTMDLFCSSHVANDSHLRAGGTTVETAA
jgi:hypothetical protein